MDEPSSLDRVIEHTLFYERTQVLFVVSHIRIVGLL
jgi:hypothetical protein